MAFPKVPNYTKQQINKAGDVLLHDKSNEESLLVLSEWRASHAYPINTFQTTLRDKLAALKLKNFLVATRLKRLPTIVDKLRRFPNMKLSQMQDIGGLRAVVDSYEEVRRIVDSYKIKSAASRFAHVLLREKDYIHNPKDTGYRSVHLIYSYKNRVAREYEGLMLELQVRTKLQHTWATAVETMGLYLDQPLKSNEGKKEWLDFFALASSAFAHIEKLPLIPKFSHLSAEETFKLVAKKESGLKVREKLKVFTEAIKTIETTKKNAFYHLISLDIENRTVDLKSFAKANFDKAKKAYSRAEEAVLKGKKIEPVLVAAGSVISLKKAYPNFFLDTREFINNMDEIIGKS